MGYYEPQWSAEEQTMVDLMVLSGYGFHADIDREYTTVHLLSPKKSHRMVFRADTEHEAIRKAFNHWNKNNA